MTESHVTPGSGSEYTSPPCAHFNYAADDPRIARLGFGVPALDLAALGYAVLTLKRGGKPPHEMLGSQGGVYHATRDPGQIQEWFGIEDMFANVGVRTGRLPFAGRQVVIIDTDVKHGEDGPGNFARFLADNRLSLPAGLPVDRSPSGGYHGWLGWPPGWGPCPERPGLLPGVDVKGDGGYVVVPPSRLMVLPDDHDGAGVDWIAVPYEWTSGCPCQLPWAPPWLGEWISTAPATGSSAGHGQAGDGIDADAVMAHGAETGKRNNTYYRLACSRYRRHGTGPEGAAAVLEDVRTAWLAGDTAGMSWNEVLTSVASARRFIEGQEQIEHRMHAAWMARGRS